MGASEQGADPKAVEGRWQVVPRTLCFVTHGDDVLLMKRAAHKRVFPNHYNGVGGHIEGDEDPRSGAIREIREETGLEVTKVQFCGTTHVNAGERVGILLFIFRAEATSRELIESDEGGLLWIPIAELLHKIKIQDQGLLLVEDLPFLLPLIFETRQLPFFAHVSYDETGEKINFRLSAL